VNTSAAESDNYWAWLRYACLTQAAADSSPLPTGEPPDELHRLLPLIYANLHRHDHAADISPALAGRLQAGTIATIAQQGIYQHWLAGFGKRLAEQGLQTILLKSSAFNGWLYPADAPRGAVDIDLWVPAEAFDACCALMTATHRPVLLDQARRATHERLFERVFEPLAQNGPSVEIHRGLTNPHLYRIDAQTLLDASRPHPGYANPALRIMSPIHNLLNLALHAARDRDFASYGLVDVHELWCRSQPAADQVLEEARRWQCAGALYLLLRNAAEHLHTPVPPTLLKQLQPAAWRLSLASRTCRLIVDAPRPPGERLAQLGANFALTDRVGNALRFQWNYLRMRLADLRQRG